MMPLPFGPAPGAGAAGLLMAGFVPHQQHQLLVRIPSTCPHRFRIVPVGGATRWFAERGLVQRVPSPDHAFDARWALETDDVEFGAALLRLESVRAAVEALATLGIGWISQARRQLVFVMSRGKGKAADVADRKAQAEAQLHAIDAQVRALLAGRHFPRRPGKARAFSGVAIGGMLLSGLMLVSCIVQTDELLDGQAAGLVLPAIGAGLLIGLAALVAAMVPFARRSTSHKELGVLCVALLPGIVMAAVSGALAINRVLDPGPAVVHEVPVQRVVRRVVDKKVKGYWAEVPDWDAPDGQATRRVGFDRTQGATLVAGETRLRLTVSPGRLGAERLLALEIVDPPAH